MRVGGRTPTATMSTRVSASAGVPVWSYITKYTTYTEMIDSEFAMERRHPTLGTGVECAGLGGQWLAFRCLGFMVYGLRFRIKGLRFRVSGLGFRVQGFDFWVED